MSLHVVAMGGTIASLPDAVSGVVRSVVPIDDLLESVPDLARFDIASAEEVSRVNGWNITPELMLTTVVHLVERTRSSAF
jgi:L-asparaginase/Glu-tRNA(Gln) amidotransferase subunit D